MRIEQFWVEMRCHFFKQLPDKPCCSLHCCFEGLHISVFHCSSMKTCTILPTICIDACWRVPDFAPEAKGNRLLKHPLLSHKNHTKEIIGDWMKMSYLSQRTDALQKSLSLEERDKVVQQVVFPSSCMLLGMRSTKSETYLISFLLPFVNSVNRRLSADAGTNDVFFFSSFCPCCFISCFLTATLYHLLHRKSEKFTKTGEAYEKKEWERGEGGGMRMHIHTLIDESSLLVVCTCVAKCGRSTP